MPTRLDQIVAATRRRVAESKATTDRSDMEGRAQAHIPRGFQKRLQESSKGGAAIIAELKKASPSRGLIRADFDPVRLAKELESAGASALSVLTDEEFFQGSLENLSLASENTSLPCLRKDFIVDEFQILESRANRADAILLIVATLSDQELSSFARCAWDLGLDTLCEVHDEAELKRALDAGCQFIGVNNRDLKTFNVDLNTALRLAELVPQSVTRVAESGIHNASDIAKLRAAGYHAFLIGESLMMTEHPGEALQALMGKAVSSF
ncbi:MAG TPA: indole-3-glycerol phosphate synthase TrpC [Terriglobales bacterium]|jgi:indole-3-glycerol phosphate synthase